MVIDNGVAREGGLSQVSPFWGDTICCFFFFFWDQKPSHTFEVKNQLRFAAKTFFFGLHLYFGQ